jgi:hypothetical protein
MKFYIIKVYYTNGTTDYIQTLAHSYAEATQSFEADTRVQTYELCLSWHHDS